MEEEPGLWDQVRVWVVLYFLSPGSWWCSHLRSGIVTLRGTKGIVLFLGTDGGSILCLSKTKQKQNHLNSFLKLKKKNHYIWLTFLNLCGLLVCVTQNRSLLNLLTQDNLLFSVPLEENITVSARHGRVHL